MGLISITGSGKLVPRDFSFSKHFEQDKDADERLVEDCIHTGSKEKEREPGKFIARKKYKKGELIVVFKESEDRTFVITAYWNQHRGKLHEP